MKEMLNQDIRSIEDRELRWLVRYEKIIAWHNAGGFAKAAAAYHAQIAEADRVKSEAELRVAQITILQHTVAGFDVKALRNAQMEKIAAQRKAEAAAERERRQIKAAIDELIAIDDFVTDDDIDDILAISSALGIELPAETDRADICQRGAKTITDLKRELGVSMSKHVEQEDDDRDTNLRVRPSKITREWIMENVIVLDAETCDWLEQHYPEAEDGFDEEALDSVRLVIAQPFDAGKTLAEIGWKPLEKAVAKPESKIDVNQFVRMLDEYKTAVASYTSVNVSPCQVTSAELLRRREEMHDHEHRLRTYVETGEIRPLGDGRVVESNGIKFTMRVASEKLKSEPASEIDESLLDTLLDWYEAATIKMANSRARNALHASSDLYEGTDARWFSVRSRRKSIIDYVLGRYNADVTRARMAT